MNLPPIIRLAKDTDKPSIAKLFSEHAAYEGAELSIEQLNLDLLDFSKIPATIYVVELNNEVLGYLSLIKQFSTWDLQHYVYVDCLYLSPELRGLGLGSKLMDVACQWGKSNNLFQIQWQTPNTNQNAIAFYQHYGAENKTKERFFLSI